MDNTQIEKIISEYNNASSANFGGLSPAQLHEIIHNPLGETSKVKFHDEIDDATLDKLPFFRIAEEFLKILARDKSIKLTPLGALPKKIMVELYEHQFLPDTNIESGLIKLWKEADCISIQAVRYTCEIAKLVKKVKGKLSLTKKGESYLINNNRSDLFKLLFVSYAHGFNWSVNDGYPEEPIGQYGYLFSIFLLLKFGNKQTNTKFYSTKYLNVFHNFLLLFSDGYSTAEEKFDDCYTIRTFERFTDWFGFTHLNRARIILDSKTDKLVTNPVISKVFYVK